MLLWGPHARFLEKRVSMGLPTPAWDRRCVPHHLLHHLWNGFFQLDRSRPFLAMHGPLAIEEQSIESWLNIHAITDPDVRVWYYDLFVAMDAIRLKALHKETDGKSSTETRKAAHGPKTGKPTLGSAPDDIHLQGTAPGDDVPGG